MALLIHFDLHSTCIAQMILKCMHKNDVEGITLNDGNDDEAAEKCVSNNVLVQLLLLLLFMMMGNDIRGANKI